MASGAGAKSGSQILTASGPAGGSGKPVRILNMSILSAGSSGTVNLHNGISTGDPVYVKETGLLLRSVIFEYRRGFLFASGCFVELDSNTSSVLVEYSQ